MLFRPRTALVSVLTGEDGNVRGAVLAAARLARDENGAVRPQITAGTEFEVPCDTILVAIGQVQVLDWLPAHYTEHGLVKADESGRVPDEEAAVFAGGDVMRGPSMVVDALGDGKRAARDIDRVLSAEPLRPEDPVEVMPYEKLNTAYFRHAPRTEAPLAPAAERRASQVTEVTLAYSREQAVAEADRCMSCGVCNGCDNCYIVCPDVSVMRDTRQNGHYSIRTHYCKGCLVCVQECPTGAWSGCRNSTSTSRATWSGWRPRSRRTRARTPSRPRSPAGSSRTRSPSTTGHENRYPNGPGDTP